MTAQRSQAALARLREEFRARADQAFDQMFGSDGQNGLVTFTEREDRACEATDRLVRWPMEEHLALDPAADPGVQVDCPIRGGAVRYESPELAELEIREFHTRRGKVEYERAACLCRTRHRQERSSRSGRRTSARTTGSRSSTTIALQAEPSAEPPPPGRINGMHPS